MLKISCIITTAFTCVFQAWACLGPSNIEGVAFTSGETMNLQNLMSLGSENVNYMKDIDSLNAGIRYKSHYDPRAIVFIGNYGMSYQENVSMACMGVIFPLPEDTSAYSHLDKSIFDFAAAVKAELVWLASKNIIDCSNALIEKIDSSLNASENGGQQYWTHTAKVFEYNMWYERDTLLGVWSAGTEGVKGVNGVYGVRGCSVVKPGDGAPPEGIGTTAIASKPAAISKVDRSCVVRTLGNGGLIVFLPQMQSKASALLTVIDCKGATVSTKRVPAGIRSMYINGLAFGRYTARLQR